MFLSVNMKLHYIKLVSCCCCITKIYVKCNCSLWNSAHSLKSKFPRTRLKEFGEFTEIRSQEGTKGKWNYWWYSDFIFNLRILTVFTEFWLLVRSEKEITIGPYPLPFKNRYKNGNGNSSSSPDIFGLLIHGLVSSFWLSSLYCVTV